MKKTEAALAYASWGWHVLPCVPNGKVPATANGVHDATTDAVKIKEWWTRNPEFNIGIATGAKSGILVYDVDPKNGGHLTWGDWVDENGSPDAMMQLTANLGQHHIAVYDDRLKSCQMMQGVDLLSDGRYFIAYPSKLNDKEYTWEADSDPFDGVGPYVTPDEWVNLILQSRNTPSDSVIKSGVDIITGGRNSGLASMAGALRDSGLHEPEILAAIAVANELRCVPPLPSSEISQIAKSVSRYEPTRDVATDTAAGNQAAQNILAGIKQEKAGFYFTRASSFLNQPAAIPWIIRRWLPQAGTGMIYGPSGVGKSFIAVDLACSIVSGREWAGLEIECQGPVVYMAGEGNWGMRQRIASWCHHNQCNDVENLLVSSMPIDMDAPGVDIDILSAIREMTESKVSVIFIDTLNRHMSGDENSAQDIRRLNNVCSMLSAATGALCVLIHHTGNGDGAKGRERGSSAIRASADVSIYVSEGKSDTIQISCSKLKEGRKPDPMLVKLEQVDLGWVDDRGEPEEPGAVVVHVKPEDAPVNDSIIIDESVFKLNKYRIIMESAWRDCGGENVNGKDYLTRSALRNYLSDVIGLKETTIRNWMTPGRNNSMINVLLSADYIAEYASGWHIKTIGKGYLLNAEIPNL